MTAEFGRKASRAAESGSLGSPSPAGRQPFDVAGGLELVLFDWAGLRLALQASQVRALRAVVEPGQPSIGQLLGLDASASDRAGTCGLAATATGPVLAVATPEGAAAERVLEVESGDRRSACFRVQEPVQTRFFAASALRQLPPLLAACLRTGVVRAIAREPLACQPSGRSVGRTDAQVRLIPVLDARRLPRLE